MKQQLTTAQCEAAAGKKKKTPKECSWKQQSRNPTPSCCRQGSTDTKNERSCSNVEEKKKEQQKQLQKKNPLHYSALKAKHSTREKKANLGKRGNPNKRQRRWNAGAGEEEEEDCARARRGGARTREQPQQQQRIRGREEMQALPRSVC